MFIRNRLGFHRKRLGFHNGLLGFINSRPGFHNKCMVFGSLGAHRLVFKGNTYRELQIFVLNNDDVNFSSVIYMFVVHIQYFSPGVLI